MSLRFVLLHRSIARLLTRKFVVICMVMTGFAGVGVTRAADKPVIKVFILAGQSNMQGQGVVEMDHPKYYNSGKGNLVNTMKDPKKSHLFKHVKDKDGRWAVRDDVWAYSTAWPMHA